MTEHILKVPRSSDIFSIPAKFVSIDNDGKLQFTMLSRPRNVILCDGCNEKIDSEYIYCLVFTEGYIHSAQCQKCVDEYFSDLPVKTYEIEYQLNSEDIHEMSQKSFFNVNRYLLDIIKEGKCACCREPIGKFKDEISVREYKISGICQTCQDKTFVEYGD